MLLVSLREDWRTSGIQDRIQVLLRSSPASAATARFFYKKLIEILIDEPRSRFATQGFV